MFARSLPRHLQEVFARSFQEDTSCRRLRRRKFFVNFKTSSPTRMFVEPTKETLLEVQKQLLVSVEKLHKIYNKKYEMELLF